MVMRWGRHGAALTLALVLGGAQAATTSSAALSGMGFSVTTGFSDSYSSAAPVPGDPNSTVQSSGFFAPFGPNPVGAPPSSAYPIRYSGMAMAMPASGILRASIQAEQLNPSVLFRGGSATASTGGSFVLLGNQVGQSVLYTVTLPFDGLLEGSSTARLSLSWRVTGTDAWTTRSFDAFPDASGTTPVFESYSVSIPGVVGQSMDMLYKLEASASTSLDDFGLADFSSTARLVFNLPAGVSVGAVDGFLTEVPVVLAPVPEPQALALLAAGLALLLPVYRRRMPLS